MRACNHCGSPSSASLCPECEQAHRDELREERLAEYKRNKPDQMDWQEYTTCPDCCGRPIVEGRQRDGSDTFWECPTCEGTGLVPDTQGKREDQVAYSAGVIVAVASLGLAFPIGGAIGATVAWIEHWLK